MSLWTYSPSDIQILIAGIYPIEGYINGSFVSVAKDIAPFSSEKASDGSVGRIYNNNDDYTITLTIMGQSPSNDVLTKLWQLDEITQRAKFPLLIKDSVGTSFFYSSNTWIRAVPPLEYNETELERTWVLKSSQGTINIGGNDDPGDILEDITNVITSSLPTLEGVI